MACSLFLGVALARPGRESASIPRDSRNSVVLSVSGTPASSSSSCLGLKRGKENSTSSRLSADRSPEVEGATNAESSWVPATPETLVSYLFKYFVAFSTCSPEENCEIGCKKVEEGALARFHKLVGGLQ